MESLCSLSLSLSLLHHTHSSVTHTQTLSLSTVILSLPYQDNFNPTRPFVISPLLSDFLLVLSAPSVLPTFSPSAFLFGSSSTRTRRGMERESLAAAKAAMAAFRWRTGRTFSAGERSFRHFFVLAGARFLLLPPHPSANVIFSVFVWHLLFLPSISFAFIKKTLLLQNFPIY